MNMVCNTLYTRLTTIVAIFLLALFKTGPGGLCMAMPQESADSTGIELFDLSGILSGEMENKPGLLRKSNNQSLSKIYNEKRLMNARANNKQKGVAAAANNLAIIYFKEREVKKALEFFNEALTARESLGDIQGAALVKGQIGYCYAHLKEYDKAITYYQSSLKTLQELAMGREAANLAGFLGDLYFIRKQYDLAKTNFMLALKFYKGTNNKKMTGKLLGKTGETALLKRDYPGALEYFNEALNIINDLNDSNLLSLLHRNKGIVYFQQEDYLKAETSFVTSFRFNDRSAISIKYLKDTYSRLAARYRIENDQEKFFYYDQLYKEFRDKIARTTVRKESETETGLAEKQMFEQLNKQKELQLIGLTRDQLELKQRITAAELERLNDEKALIDLNRSLVTSEKEKQERDQEIEKLKNEKTQLDLVLLQNEKELYRKTKNNIILLASTLLILLLTFFIYSRYRFKKKSLGEINKAYAELKSAQEQLIHSEKMASLGQLTAGIAHEIQNPLNFVNNFSDLSTELLAELEQVKTETERAEIISQLRENLTRIHQHGKRADHIVKGMLAHSRTSQPEKEPTDLNALCEEFLNLAYHGMRAQDSSFNCTLVKNLSPGLPKVLIIPQDVSRVLLNLFNNAFYAINEKAKRIQSNGSPAFKPMVELETAQNASHFLIRVKDNGGGIPDAIKKRIFNPFFTTKPVGKGTGLGLSLSYDIIVKGHQGEINVESDKEKGTIFTISLPKSNGKVT